MFYGTHSLNVTGIFLFHQSCAMFLLIQSLKNGSLKDIVSPSTSHFNSCCKDSKILRNLFAEW